jgi:bis(5'-nucleosidyl)-tetraphosphatase
VTSLKACGWIILTKSSQILLLKNQKRQDWGLPKGHVEDGETEKQTALRELNEETGLLEKDLSVHSEYKKEINYSYINKKGQRINKSALFFKAFSKERSVTLSVEHDAFCWAPWPQVIRQLEHRDLRHLVLEAMNV